MSHPTGTRLPALERNILKYRALEMVLILFYSEALKAFIIGTIKATDSFRRNQPQRILPQTKKKFEVALNAFLDDGVITQNEYDEIPKLVDYRNLIAHDIEKLTGDIGRTGIAGDFCKFMGVKYDHEARKRLKFFNTDIPNRVGSRYCMPISMNELLFEAAEKTYEDEIKCLIRKICKQLETRKEDVRRLKNELSLGNSELIDENDLYGPGNKYNNGRLTPRGEEICYRLFDIDKSPLVVANLLDISYKAAVKRLKTWRSAGGEKRKKVNHQKIRPLAPPSI